MRIHSNTLTRQDFTDAAKRADVTLVDLTEHGSQSRARAFVFYLSGSGTQGGQWGTQNYKTATWDEWGIVFAHLFHVDPQAHCGKNGYRNAEHYHWSTDDRFRTLTPLLQHKRHNWSVVNRSITGNYMVAQCKCGAVNRWMAYGHDWEEIAS